MAYHKLLLPLIALTVASCNPEIWSKIDEYERTASRYGTVTVGAVRVANYEDATLEASRQRLRNTIGKLRNEIDESLKPELASAHWSERAWYLKLGIDLGSILKFPTPDQPAKAGQDTKIGDTTTSKSGTPSGSLDALKDLLKDMSVEPNRIDALIYKLSVLRFLESELESRDLRYSNPVDSHYHRIQVSVSLTAWTVPPATSALVYLDLYPLDGDWWCHETIRNAKQNETIKNIIQKKKDTDMEALKLEQIATRANERLLKAFHDKSYPLPDLVRLSDKDLERWFDPSKTRSDPYTGCHRWLIEHHLLPKLVHVEPLGDSRYVMINQGSEMSHDIGLDVNAGK